MRIGRRVLIEPAEIDRVIAFGRCRTSRESTTQGERMRMKLALDEKSDTIQKALGPDLERYDPWQVRGFQDAMRGTAAPPWVIQDLLLAESATLVSAQPHAMKSLSWLAACLDAVVTKKVWGHFDAPSVDSVLFLETEDPPWMVEGRIRGLAKGLGLSERDEVPGFHYACVGPFDFLEEKGRIADMVQKYMPKFLVLSTLQNLLGGADWNSQADMQPVMAEMIKISRGCPLILVTHSPWDSRQRRAAGSVTQTANFITAMHYKKYFKKGSGETFVDVAVDSKAGAAATSFCLKLEIDKSKPGDPGAVRRLLYAGKRREKATGKAEIIEAIEENPDADTAEIAELTGRTRRYVQKIRKERKKENRPQKPAFASRPCIAA